MPHLRASYRPAASVLLAAACLLPGCAAKETSVAKVIGPLPGGVSFTSAGSPVGDLTLPVMSMDERKFDTVVRQRYDFSCGSAALATLLRFHYGDSHDEEDAFRGMWAEGDRDQIRKLGFSLLDMKRYLATIGYQADGYQVSLDEIEKTGIPGVTLIDLNGYKHFVVLKGVKGEEVLVGDPSLGIKTMKRDDFQKMWSGVYFVINAEPGRAKNFNTDAQWARYARGPSRGAFLEPLSIQALMLTAPFQREY